MMIPSAHKKWLNLEEPWTVYRAGGDQEEADGWNISMAAGSLCHYFRPKLGTERLNRRNCFAFCRADWIQSREGGAGATRNRAVLIPQVCPWENIYSAPRKRVLFGKLWFSSFLHLNAVFSSLWLLGNWNNVASYIAQAAASVRKLTRLMWER